MITGFLYHGSLRSRTDGVSHNTGPPTLPIIGNLHQIPTQNAFFKFADWAKQYGEIYSLKVASTTTVVLSSRRLVKELMDKKNSITSDRPPSYAANKLIYKGDFLLLMSYDSPRFRLQRRLIHQFYMENMAEKTHFPYIYAESAQLFKDIMDDPNEFANHAFRYTNSLIMTTGKGDLSFGHNPADKCLPRVRSIRISDTSNLNLSLPSDYESAGGCIASYRTW